ncbi:MAG: type IV secretory system conjugative DNA transfer family protein [Saprospiraceae bacterium]
MLVLMEPYSLVLYSSPSIASASFSRVNIPEESRVPFMVYMDEFHNFTTLSLVNMFSELRKFKVGISLAHQYMAQLDDDIKSAVLGNAGTRLISFRLGTEDAMQMSKEMYPEFDVEDFINLQNARFT